MVKKLLLIVSVLMVNGVVHGGYSGGKKGFRKSDDQKSNGGFVKIMRSEDFALEGGSENGELKAALEQIQHLKAQVASLTEEKSKGGLELHQLRISYAQMQVSFAERIAKREAEMTKKWVSETEKIVKICQDYKTLLSENIGLNIQRNVMGVALVGFITVYSSQLIASVSQYVMSYL